MTIRTISDVEDVLNEFTVKYGHDKWNLPAHAARVLLWPTDSWRLVITPGPTAVIRIGCARTVKQDFRLVLLGTERKKEIVPAVEYLQLIGSKLKAAIDHIAKHHLYECVSIERTADILRRDSDGKRFRRITYGFDEELVPHMLRSDEMVIRHVERIEVVHRASGLREVVEAEMGRARSVSVYTMIELAKSRLSRSVRVAESPFDLPIDDPDWIGRTA